MSVVNFSQDPHYKWKKYKFNFYKDFMQSYDEDSDKKYIFKVDVEYP